MTFELSREHEEFRRSVREFAEAEIGPHAAQWDKDHHFPADVVQKMGGLGLMGLTAPEEYGGAGEDGDFTSLCVAIEEIGRVDQSMGITLEAAVGLGINPILTFGSREQQDQWLPGPGQRPHARRLRPHRAGRRLRRRQHPHQGRPRQRRVGGQRSQAVHHQLRLRHHLAGHGHGAHRAQRDDGKPEISTIIVPAGTDGFTVEPAYDKLGWHASDTHGLTFTDCRVPEGNLLGERGRGLSQFLATLDDGRVAIAALAVGCIQACLDLSLKYAGERQTFGGPIGRKQGVAFQIADLQVMAETSRLLTYKAAAMKDAGAGAKAFKQAASIAKLHATESAVTATRIATQVFGGNGFMEEYPVVRFYRDAKVLEIGEGTSEVQRMLIARGLGLPVE